MRDKKLHQEVEALRLDLLALTKHVDHLKAEHRLFKLLLLKAELKPQSQSPQKPQRQTQPRIERSRT